VAAAAAWDSLAAELHATTAQYESVISALTAEWEGPSSARMAAAAAPYMTWMAATAAQAEQAAAQARAAAAAFETAYIATVPPAAVAANRSLLTALIATNFLGQNTAAIAASEAQYAQMWAQDAAAMYGYAGASAAASSLTPFQPPPQTTSEAGTAAQAATVTQATGTQAQSVPQAMSGVSQTLQSLAAPAAAAAPAADPPFTPAEILQTLLTSFFNITIGPYTPSKVYDPFGAFYDLGVQSFLAPFSNFNMQQSYMNALGSTGAVATGATLSPGQLGAFHPGTTAGGLGAGARFVGSAGDAVSAGMGRAGLVGSLSVPQGWVSAAPAIRSVAAVFPPSSLGAVPAAIASEGQPGLLGNMALSGLAGRAMVGPGGAISGSIGTGAGVAPGAATTATIIVIPED
jgi:PPE-repeat protein